MRFFRPWCWLLWYWECCAGLFGISVPRDWGQVLSFARNWMTSLDTYWYIIVYPGIALVLFVMGWNLLGDALRDVLDPRLRGKV